MKIYLWIYLVVSLKMVTSKIVPLRLSSKDDEIVSPIFSHRRKTVPYSNFAEKSDSFLDWDDFDSVSSMEDNFQPEDVDEVAEEDANLYSKEEKEVEIVKLSNLLKEILQKPGPWKPPMIVFHDSLKEFDDSLDFPDLENLIKVDKRSRYYRRYPWKRQNSRSRSMYDYDSSQHLCTPSRKELFELLASLQNTRTGTKIRRFRFCKRHKQPRTVYSNVRFVGRRK